MGYSRAVRVGNTIEVSGTVAIEDGDVVGLNDPYAQAKKILEIIINAIENLGGKKDNIIRTRTYVTDIAYWESVGKAHGEIFSEIMPATSLIEISGLISPDFLVEIEATAII